MKFYLEVEDSVSNSRLMTEVVGMDIAYEAYDKACKLAEILNLKVYLIVAETGEIIIDNCLEE